MQSSGRSVFPEIFRCLLMRLCIHLCLFLHLFTCWPSLSSALHITTCWKLWEGNSGNWIVVEFVDGFFTWDLWDGRRHQKHKNGRSQASSWECEVDFQYTGLCVSIKNIYSGKYKLFSLVYNNNYCFPFKTICNKFLCSRLVITLWENTKISGLY